jgi:hypothetical protein
MNPLTRRGFVGLAAGLSAGRTNVSAEPNLCSSMGKPVVPDSLVDCDGGFLIPEPLGHQMVQVMTGQISAEEYCKLRGIEDD